MVLIEREHDAGEKLHTTGIVVKEAADELGLLGDLPPELIRPIGGVRLYGSRLNGVALDLPGYFFLATDTPILMRWLISQASDAGRRRALGPPAFVVIGVEGSAAALAMRFPNRQPHRIPSAKPSRKPDCASLT